jgi:hypothetical protein
MKTQVLRKLVTVIPEQYGYSGAGGLSKTQGVEVGLPDLVSACHQSSQVVVGIDVATGKGITAAMGELNDKLSDPFGRKIMSGCDFLTKPSCYFAGR